MNTQIKTVLFDLDGTLTDSAPGIIHSVQQALREIGIEPWGFEELKVFVGPPLTESFQTYFGLKGELLEQAVLAYRRQYKKTGMFENKVYPQILHTVQTLRKWGKTLAIATSKPETFAIPILERFALRSYFDVIGAATLEEGRNSKESVIRYTLQKLKLDTPAGCILVGDRRYDVEGAAAVGMPCIGVLYGYGGKEELEKAGARYLAETPEDVLEICR